MSHADTIRAAIENDYTTVGAKLGHEALEALVAENQRLSDAASNALKELGVPNDDYPAAVANAVTILHSALDEHIKVTT